MQKLWIAAVLLAAACAAPQVHKPEIQIGVRPSEPGRFAVDPGIGDPETRRYPIKPEELLATRSKAVFDGRPSDGSMTIPPVDSFDDLATGALVEAVGVIRTFVAPQSWNEDARCALYVEKGEIVARNTPVVLAQVERLLETLKSNRLAQIRLRVRFITLLAEELAAFKHLPALREGHGGIVDRKELDALLAKESAGGVRVTGVPRLTLFHGQRGLVTMGARIPYLKATETKGADYEAVIDVVNSGLDFDVRAVAHGGGRILVDAVAAVQELNSITTLKLADYVIQRPETISHRSSGQFLLGPDEAALILTPVVRSGIIGSLGGPPPPARVQFIVFDVDQVE
jgi:hypothetical protein